MDPIKNLQIDTEAFPYSEKEFDAFVESLEAFGKLDSILLTKEKIEIKITDGFSNKGMAPFKLGIDIAKWFPSYPIAAKTEVDENLFHLILTKDTILSKIK